VDNFSETRDEMPVDSVDSTGIEIEHVFEDNVDEFVEDDIPCDVMIAAHDDEFQEDTDIEIPEDTSEEEIDWERTSLSPSEEALILKMEENGEIEIPEEDPELADPEHAELHIPNSSGEFSGERGNSEFRPSDEDARKIMAEFGCDTIEFHDGYPNFSPFTTHQSPWGEIDCQVEIGHMTDHRENPSWEFGARPRGSGHDPSYDLGNFAQADNSLLEQLCEAYPDATIQDVVSFRKDNHLTWHECADGKTMQLVPTIIHDACRHSGGVSEMKYRMAWGDVELPY
jgi:hypothetical protein